jgi:hypothetical protein
MKHNKGAFLTTAIILGVVVLAGVLGVSLQASEPVGKYPNDRANHHPVKPNN